MPPGNRSKANIEGKRGERRNERTLAPLLRGKPKREEIAVRLAEYER